MTPLYKRLHVNTAILWIQSNGNQLQAKKVSGPTFASKGIHCGHLTVVNKALEQVDFKIQRSGNGSIYEKGQLPGQI